MNLRPFLTIGTIQILLRDPVDKVWKPLTLYSIGCMIFSTLCISLYVEQSKYSRKEIPFRGRHVLEFFCVPLYTDYGSDVPKKFLVTSAYDSNVKFQTWSFCFNLFLSCVDRIHRPIAKNVIFWWRGPQTDSKICPQNRMITIPHYTRQF